MPLDTNARRYADNLYNRDVEKITAEQRQKEVEVRRNFAARNMFQSGGAVKAITEVDIERIQLMANARVRSLIAAYEKANLQFDDTALDEISIEISNLCTIWQSHVVKHIEQIVHQSFNGTQPPGLVGSLTQTASSKISSIRARIVRDLRIKRDEVVLETQNTSSLSPEEYRNATTLEPRLDPLLKIRDRGEYDNDLASLWEQHSRIKQPLALIIVDIDHFKKFNDTFGHDVGDRVLQQTAGVIESVVIGKGRAYRYGGEELTVLLSNFCLGEAVAIAERARTEILNTQIEDCPESVTASFGVSSYPETTIQPSDLFKQADDALYQSKEKGRNCVSAAIPLDMNRSNATSTMRKKAGTIELWITLRQAISRNYIIGVRITQKRMFGFFELTFKVKEFR